MITFNEFDEAIANVAIDAVFPTKRDLYKKTIYSHDNNDDEIGMSYAIMPFGSEIYRIGFIHEQSSSMFTMWNGKLDHIVFDVDERDGCIRYYHEPELYDRDHGLSHSQIQTIGETLIKYLTSNKEEDASDERYVKYDPAISLEQIQSVIERWMKSNNVTCNACESKFAGSFYYDLYDGKFIKGSVTTAGDEKEILIWINTDTPVMRITPSIVSLIQGHVPSFTDKEVYDLYNEISESAVLLEEKGTKKHPLQNSPTFPEGESAEEKQCPITVDELPVATEDKPDGKSGKPIDPFKTVPIFKASVSKPSIHIVLTNGGNSFSECITT